MALLARGERLKVRYQELESSKVENGKLLERLDYTHLQVLVVATYPVHRICECDATSSRQTVKAEVPPQLTPSPPPTHFKQ